MSSPKKYSSLPSGEKRMLTFSRASPPGHGMVARDLLLAQVVELQRDVADLPAIDELGRAARQQDHEPLERIDLHAADARAACCRCSA